MNELMEIDPKPCASHFIDGAYVEDAQGEPMEVIYPASGEVIGRVYAATPAVIEAALGAAERAQKAWALVSAVERGRVLRRAADIIRARNRELSVLETYDTGKALQETLYVDATSAADALEYFGGVISGVCGEQIPLGDDFAYTLREPLGVCVGLGAWNYPTQIAGWKGAPALACGNAMVFKPSEITPLCALKIAEILTEAGLPKGLFNVVQGAGNVGKALVGDRRVAKVSLTGSVPTGKKVYEAAARDMKHVTMELGGKSPLLIFEDAPLEQAVSAALLGNMYSTGQVCSNGTRVFVHSDIYEAFLEQCRQRVEGIIIGDPMDEATQMGPMVSKAQRDIVLGYIEAGKAQGARLICGGEAMRGAGFYIKPTIFADVEDEMTIAREEIFGPVMSVLRFDKEEEAIARANQTEFGLSGGVFTRDFARAHRVVRALQAGTCYINTYNDAPVEMPFGGAKLSGIGRENSKHALAHYSQIKTVYAKMTPLEKIY